MGLVGVLAMLSTVGLGVFSASCPLSSGSDTLPPTYTLRVYEAQTKEGRFAVQVFAHDVLVGELGRKADTGYFFSNSQLVLPQELSQADAKTLSDCAVTLSVQTRAMLLGHAYDDGGPARSAKNVRRVTLCTVDALFGTMTFSSNVSFSDDALHRQYTLEPVPQRHLEQTAEVCRRLTDVITPKQAMRSPETVVAPTTKALVSPINDGKVMLACWAQNFYPAEINITFVAPRGRGLLMLRGDSMPVFAGGSEGRGGDKRGKYDRTDFLFVDASLIRNVTCLVDHVAMDEAQELGFPPNAVGPLSARRPSISIMPTYNLMQFIKTRDPNYIKGPAHVECTKPDATSMHAFVCLE